MMTTRNQKSLPAQYEARDLYTIAEENDGNSTIPRDLYTIAEENDGNSAAAADSIDRKKGQQYNESTIYHNNKTKQQKLNNDDDSWRYYSVDIMLSFYENSFMI